MLQPLQQRGHMTDYILTLRCKNQRGIVAAIGARIASHGGDITEANQFDDPETGMFFMRVAFAMDEAEQVFRTAIAEEEKRFGLDLTLRSAGLKRKVLLLVSKFDHCLGDLLYRMRIGELQHGSGRHRRQPSARGAEPDADGGHSLPPPADYQGHQAAAGSADPRADRAERRRTGGAGPLHAGAVGRVLGLSVGTLHQHPPQLPAGLQGRQALSSGARARREDDRGHGALRDRRPRRGTDHLPGRGVGQPCRHARRSRAQGPRHRATRAGARGCAGISRTASCSTSARPSCS